MSVEGMFWTLHTVSVCPSPFRSVSTPRPSLRWNRTDIFMLTLYLCELKTVFTLLSG